MKTITRIRRNGGKKSRPSQVQTRRAKPGADNVRIFISEPDGKIFADFEIPKEMHAAIVRDAQSKGIGVMQWIEDAVRERLKKHVPVESYQVAAGQSQQIAEMVIPSKIALECKDALSLLEEVGSAAGALVMMNAEVIKESVKVNDGWQAFEVPRFDSGAQELARMIVAEFHSVFAELDGYLSGMISSIENCSEPIKTVSRDVYFNLLKGSAGSRKSHQIENAVHSFQHCIEIQGSALDSRNNAGAYDIGRLMQDRLSGAFKTILAAKGNLEDAYLAATVRYNPSAVERMVAS